MLYSDGGPDHRVTYVSVKLALISLFLDLDFDLLVALRTAPNNSWANPVERIMSINIGLQGVGVMRSKVGDVFEKAVGWYNLLSRSMTLQGGPEKILLKTINYFVVNSIFCEPPCINRVK